MKRNDILKICMASMLSFIIALTFIPSVKADELIQHENFYVYQRLYNPKTGEHSYETSRESVNNALKHGYQLESGSLLVDKMIIDTHQSLPIFSLYNSRTQAMMYTTNTYERDFLMSLNPKNYKIQAIWYWTDGLEGVQPDQGIPVYRLYNPNSWRGSHHFTPIQAEKELLVRLGWHYEGVGFYVSGVLNK